ncbi:MAG: ABC transporter ATP-binding protein [Alphaproteobacteria bacterium]|nr:ABC transporter ATP-binding protein [Alphaproteobacteria bacterium]
MIVAKDLSVAYGRGESVLTGVSLEARAGELVAVIGANGAGKTTLARALSGLVPARSGSISFAGQSIERLDAHKIARMGLAHVPQGRRIVPELSVRDNLEIGTYGLGASLEDIENRLRVEFTRFPILEERRNVRGGALSGGEQQMLSLSRALMMKPKAIIMDEPSLGLAPFVVGTIMTTARGLADQGLAVLLIEQAAILALRHADTGYVLQGGRVVLKAPAKELLRDEKLVASYLG